MSGNNANFGMWLHSQLGGKKWCVAARMTPGLKERGYEVALTPARYAAMEVRYLLETGKSASYNAGEELAMAVAVDPAARGGAAEVLAWGILAKAGVSPAMVHFYFKAGSKAA